MEHPQQTPANGETYWQDSASYHGVICGTDAQRLIVSPHGKQYSWQTRFDSDAGERFAVTKCRKLLSHLLPFLPSELVRLVPADTPDNAVHFVRPWAQEMENTRQAILASRWASEQYAGVIAAKGRWRLIWFAKANEPARYAVQQKRPDWQGGFRIVSSFEDLCDLFQFVASFSAVGRGHVDLRELSPALSGLPESADDYAGVRPVSTGALIQPRAGGRISGQRPAEFSRGRRDQPLGGRGSQTRKKASSGPQDRSGAFGSKTLRRAGSLEP